MSIQKIARIAGVSVATVSRVLNNNNTVKPGNRERVLNAIKASNYRPNLLARQLRTARSHMLLVMVSNVANPFCAAVVRGIETEAEQKGYHILLCNSESDVARSRYSLQLLSGKMVDGVITMDAVSRLPELQALIGGSPWVQCAEHDDNAAVSSVGINDVEASRYAVQRFINHGRRRVAMINHDMKYQYAQLREQGYQDIVTANRLTFRAIEYADELSFLGGKQAMQRLLAAGTLPDAVFAVSDTLAAGAIKAIIEHGLAVPRDIAVTGFDGTELGYITTPQLSTIQQPSMAMGREAVRLLLKQIDDPASPVEKVILDWDYIGRESD